MADIYTIKQAREDLKVCALEMLDICKAMHGITHISIFVDTADDEPYYHVAAHTADDDEEPVIQFSDFPEGIMWEVE